MRLLFYENFIKPGKSNLVPTFPLNYRVYFVGWDKAPVLIVIQTRKVYTLSFRDNSLIIETVTSTVKFRSNPINSYLKYLRDIRFNIVTIL